jgi:hypothetical protein
MSLEEGIHKMTKMKTKTKTKSILSMVALLALVLSVSLLGACGSGDTPAGDQTETTGKSEATATTESGSPDKGAADIIEPSQLISQEEAGLIMGETMDSAETMEQQTIGLKQTFYTSSESGEMLQVTLHQQAFMPSEQSMTPEDLYRAITTDFPGAIEADGIGDEAWLATPGLHILADGYYIVIAAGNMSVEGNEEMLREGGRVAVENLRALIQ